MLKPPARSKSENREIAKVAVACLIGTTIEWYDFFLYGTAAALVFNQIFFPTFDPLSGTLAAFATHAVGFAARPIGGAIFGHYGDRLGRKTMLSLSLLIMGLASFAIGLLPTYQAIGVYAPCLLVALRLIQGIAIGGEWGGAVVLAFEHAPEERRGLFGSLPQIGVPAGLLLGSLAFSLTSAYSGEQLYSWGWRVPFLLSAVLVVIGLAVRLSIAESPVFLEMKQAEKPAQQPLLAAVRNHWRGILIAMGARVAENAVFYIYTVFIIVYGTQKLGLTKDSILHCILLAAGIELFSIPLFGHLSDKIGRRPVYLFGAAFSLFFSFPFFLVAAHFPPASLTVALVSGLAVGHAAMYGPQASFFSELFGTDVRYSGTSIGYQLASVFAGGLSPLIATTLLQRYGGEPWGVACYMFSIAAVTTITIGLERETRNRNDGAKNAANEYKLGQNGGGSQIDRSGLQLDSRASNY